MMAVLLCIKRGVTTGILLLLFMLVIQHKQSAKLSNLAPATSIQHTSHHGRKRGDGCHHIFLDVGANIGVHSRFLFEPKLYPQSVMAQNIYNEQFGKEDRDKLHLFCAFAFEPNPNHEVRHMKLENVYEEMGWRYHYIQAAASDTDGNLTFYHNNDEGNMEWGFGAKGMYVCYVFVFY